MLRSLVTTAFVACLASTAFADLTVKQTITATAMGQQMNGQMVTELKGNKMRTEQTMAGMTTAVIVDLDAQQVITLHETKREAEVQDLRKLAAQQKAATVPGVQASIKPTGQKKTILDQVCDGYEFRASVPTDMGMGKMDMILTGLVWVAGEAPGAAEYARFHKALAAVAPPSSSNPQEQGMAELTKALAGLDGFPYSMEMQMQVDAAGPMADMLKSMGASMNFTVTEVSAGPLPDERFVVPADYKVTTK
jgi:hypothetical protein